MRVKFIFLVTLIPAVTFVQTYKKHTAQKDRLSIQLSDGVMNIIPLSNKAIRVGRYVFINWWLSNSNRLANRICY